ncbi:unnamed protein product [Schistocephalus solidus]|uniref:SBF2 domain-containing protein n=1 Tax=Schistocephalus solidus TaxID=70667 RepID=A0A183T6J9_SCHSO|nr:unnamed protein product [Schistocephalus solidus]
MNFGSFLRNLSSDRETAPEEGKKPSDGFTSASLFGAPSRFLGSMTAKTGNLVSDFSQKVDLANKIDTIKRHASIDKIGQSVLGSAFSYSTPKSQESTPAQPADETWVMPPKSSASPQNVLHEPAVQRTSLDENQTLPIIESEEPRKAQMLTHEESTERHQNPFNFESKRIVEPSNISAFSSSTTSTTGNTPLENPDVSQSAFSTSFDRLVVQQSGSVDYGGASTRSAAPVKRQITTPGYSGKPPPRPPPPRSGHQSIDDPFQKPVVNSAVKEQSSPVAITHEKPIAETQSPEKTFSAGDIDYLTRMQCQEIVSAVDTMIADDMEYGLQSTNPTDEQPRSTNGCQYNSYEFSETMPNFESSQLKSRSENRRQQEEVEVGIEHQEVDKSSSPFFEASDASSASEYGLGGSEAVYGTEDVNEYRRSAHWPEVYETAEVHPETPTYFAELVKEAVPEDASKKELETFVEEYVEGLVNGR